MTINLHPCGKHLDLICRLKIDGTDMMEDVLNMSEQVLYVQRVWIWLVKAAC